MADLALVRAEAICAYTVARISGHKQVDAAVRAWDRIRELGALDILQHHPAYHWLIQDHTIPAYRTSSAKARGKAKQYPYWGTAKYEIYWSARLGGPVSRCISRASSTRRSSSLAEKDTDDQAEYNSGIVINSIGYLCKTDQTSVEIWYLERYYAQAIEAENFNKINNMLCAS